MAKAQEVRNSKKVSDRPFGAPVDDETFETLIPEGAESGKIPQSDQYIGKLIGLTKGTGTDSGNPYWRFDFTIVEGDYAGMDFNIFCTLTANSLWKLADTLTALGVDWEPGQPINFKRSDVLNTLCRLNIRDGKDNRDGRDISRLQGILPHPDGAGKKGKKGSFVVPSKVVEEEDDEDQEEEAPAPKRGRRVVEEDDDQDEEEERPARRSGKAPSMDDVWSKGAKKRPRDDEEDEEEEAPRRPGRPRSRVVEDEEEEDERPARKSARRSRL